MTHGNRLEKNPVLVIGLGGTGGDVAVQVKNICEKDFGGGDSLIEVVAFDTSSSTKQGLATGSEFVSFRKLNHRGFMRQIHRPGGLWRKLIPEFSSDLGSRQLGDGSGGTRMIGALTFAHYEDRIRGILSEALDRLSIDRVLDDGTKIGFDSPDIHIVTSTGGGTGSGMIVRLMVLLQSMLSTRYDAESKPNITCHLVLPEAFTELDEFLLNQLRVNTFALLTEIENMSDEVMSFADLNRVDWKELDDGWIADATYLLDGRSNEAGILRYENLIQQIGGMIVYASLSNVGNLYNEYVNNNVEKLKTNDEGFYKFYSSYGFSKMELPEALNAMKAIHINKWLLQPDPDASVDLLDSDGPNVLKELGLSTSIDEPQLASEVKRFQRANAARDFKLDVVARLTQRHKEVSSQSSLEDNPAAKRFLNERLMSVLKLGVRGFTWLEELSSTISQEIADLEGDIGDTDLPADITSSPQEALSAIINCRKQRRLSELQRFKATVPFDSITSLKKLLKYHADRFEQNRQQIGERFSAESRLLDFDQLMSQVDNIRLAWFEGNVTLDGKSLPDFRRHLLDEINASMDYDPFKSLLDRWAEEFLVEYDWLEQAGTTKSNEFKLALEDALDRGSPRLRTQSSQDASERSVSRYTGLYEPPVTKYGKQVLGVETPLDQFPDRIPILSVENGIAINAMVNIEAYASAYRDYSERAMIDHTASHKQIPMMTLLFDDTREHLLALTLFTWLYKIGLITPERNSRFYYCITDTEANAWLMTLAGDKMLGETRMAAFARFEELIAGQTQSELLEHLPSLIEARDWREELQAFVEDKKNEASHSSRLSLDDVTEEIAQLISEIRALYWFIKNEPRDFTPPRPQG